MTVRRALPLLVFLIVASLPAWAVINITPATLPNGNVSGSYPTVTLGSNPFVAGITWSVSAGSLPPGVSLNAATGVISPSGSLTSAGSFTFTISATVTGANPNSGTMQYTINVIGITTATPMPGGDVGVAYSQQLTAAGAVGSTTWVVSSNPQPPPGLTLNSNGKITGIPTTAGSYTFSVTVTDSVSNFATGSLTISVIQAAITPESLPSATVGNIWTSQGQLSTTPALAGLTWSVSSGTLPQGLSLNATSGLISGQFTKAGPYEFLIIATGAAQVAQQPFEGIVAAGGTSPTLDVTSFSTKASVGIAFSSTAGATGGVPPYTFVFAGSSTVNGLTISSGGTVSGTPTIAGVAPLPINVRDSQGNLGGGQVIVQVIGVTTGALPNGAIGTAYSQQLTAGGVVGGATWTLGANPLPPGLGLSPTGIIAGTPTTNGTYPFNVTVTDGTTNAATATLSITIGTVTSGTLSITTTSPTTQGVINDAYTNTLQATGGTAPYAWSITPASLPPGLAIAATTGILSGTPTRLGTYPMSVTVTDSASPQHSVTATITLVIGSSTLSITTTTPLPNGSVGTFYSVVLAASGGTGPYNWKATGLPAGLSLSSGGTLSGTPSVSGTTSNISITVTDSATPTPGTSTTVFSITITAAPLNITTTSPLPPGPVNVPYSKALQAMGGTGPYTWSLTSALGVSAGPSTLPPGLTLAASTGVISGTPTSAGTTTFSVTVTDSSSPALSVSASFSIVITNPTLTVTGVSASCFVATVGRPFPDSEITPPPSCPTNNTYQFTATGGTAPYTFGPAVAGALPPGLTLGSNGVLNGTPTAAGSYTFFAVATDSLQAQGALSATIVVVAIGQVSSVNISLTGSTGNTIGANLQPSVVLSVGNTFPFPVNGTVTVSFVSSVGGFNTLVTFANGVSAKFNIPALTQTATVGALVTGTQAGTITLTATQFTDDFGNIITLAVPATVSYTLAPAVPVILNVAVSNSTPSGFTLAVTGYSDTRDMTSAQFNFTAAAGDTLAASSVTVPLTTPFAAWYSSAGSDAFGSAFVLTIPFTFSSTGTTKPVTGVTVTLTNSVGASITSALVTP